MYLSTIYLCIYVPMYVCMYVCMLVNIYTGLSYFEQGFGEYCSTIKNTVPKEQYSILLW